jgi:hypothetical protein
MNQSKDELLRQLDMSEEIFNQMDVCSNSSLQNFHVNGSVGRRIPHLPVSHSQRDVSQEIYLKNILPHNVERHRRQSQIRSNRDTKHRRNSRNATILGLGNSFRELPELDREMVSFSTIQEWISWRVQKACGCSCRGCGLYVRAWSHAWSTTSHLKTPKVINNSLINKFITSILRSRQYFSNATTTNTKNFFHFQSPSIFFSRLILIFLYFCQGR